MKLVTAPVGVQVRLDGALLGASPLSFELAPGKHTLQVSKNGYGEAKRSLAGVRDGQTLSIELVDLELKALSRLRDSTIVPTDISSSIR